jgi:hypothetical protein
MKKLIVTLPDGRHRTNLDVLVSLPKVKEHFKKITEIVKKHLVRESEKK